jgi:hypothetical protein
MKPLRWLSLSLLTLVLVQNPLHAADKKVTDAIPADVSVLVRLKSPKATTEKVASFVDMVQPGFGGQVRQNAPAIGLAISNPTLAGVDMTGDWYIAVFLSAEDPEPTVAFLIPATDAKAMKDGLGDGMHFVKHDKWGVYSEDEETIALIKTVISGKEEHLDPDDEDAKAAAALFDQGDLSVYVNLAQIVDEYKDQITQAKEQLSQLLENAPAQAPDVPGLNPQALAKAAGKVIEQALAVVDESETLIVALSVSKQGIVIEEYVQFAKDGIADKFLKSSQTSAMPTLTSLPVKQAAYFGISCDLASFAKWGTELIETAYAGDDKMVKEIKTAIADIGKLKFGPAVSSIGIGEGAEGVLRGATVVEVSDPQKLRAIGRKMSEMTGAIKTPGVKQTIEYKADAEKYGANSADLTTVKQEFEAAGDPGAEIALRFVKLMYGENGMTTRSVYLKDRVISTVGGGKEEMTAALAASKGGSSESGSKALLAARGQHGNKTNLLAFVDLPNLIVGAIRVAADGGVLPIPIEKTALEGLQIEESYLGFSVGAEPGAVRIKTNIPTEQVKGLAKIAMFGVALQMQARQN